jgi:UDP-N-acetylmuramate--alanine ligase
MCVDHPEVKKLADKVRDRRIIRYGFAEEADVRGVNVRVTREGVTFDVVARRSGEGPGVTLHDLFLPVAGRHNLQNAIAAIAVARELGVTDAGIRTGLKRFAGVKRRFTTVGYWNDVRIVDDYGHHPVEIAAVLKAARESTKGQVIAVMQPHRYTRLQSLFEPFSTCFNDADAVIVAEVYPAGEAPIEGIDRDHLVASVRARGHRQVIPLPGPQQLAGIVKGLAKPGDYVVCLGAGNITQWAYALAGELKALK